MRMLNLVCAVLCVSMFGCGKFGPPVPPSALGPQKPPLASVKVENKVVVVSWGIPSSDRRGKDLISLDDIRVYRRKLPSVLEISQETDLEWELVKSNPVSDFVKKNDETAPGPLAGALQATAKSPSNQTVALHEFRDAIADSAGVYQYVLLGTNQDGVRGEATDFFQVSLFQDGTSEVVVIPNTKHKI